MILVETKNRVVPAMSAAKYYKTTPSHIHDRNIKSKHLLFKIMMKYGVRCELVVLTFGCVGGLFA